MTQSGNNIHAVTSVSVCRLRRRLGTEGAARRCRGTLPSPSHQQRQLGAGRKLPIARLAHIPRRQQRGVRFAASAISARHGEDRVRRCEQHVHACRRRDERVV